MKGLITTMLVFCLFLSLHAQQSHIGLFTGLSYYSGELSENHADISELHFALGVQYRYEISRYVALRTGLHFGKISGSDANSRQTMQQDRNLSFHSKLSELQFIGEFSLFRIVFEHRNYIISPYLFGGLAVFHFNPKTEYNNQVVKLQPLGTEGQGIQGFPDQYKLLQTAIPFGFGIKMQVNPLMTIGVELGLRRTFTDYLDDVSTIYVDKDILTEYNGLMAANLSDRTSVNPILDESPTPGSSRGNPQTKDWYYFTGLSIYMSLNRYKQTQKVKLKI